MVPTEKDLLIALCALLFIGFALGVVFVKVFG